MAGNAALNFDDVLNFDPFEGDFGDQGDKVLQNKMVRARKQHDCCHCGGPITIGELHRYQSGRFDGELSSWRWCALCCEAMAETMREFADGEDEDGELAYACEMAFENRVNACRSTPAGPAP